MGGVSELRAGRIPSEGLLCRSEIEKSAKEMLHRGGWGNPDVLLVQTEAGPVVVKDFSPRSGWVRRWLGPWSLRREEQAYRHLEGLAAVPRLLGRVDELAIILEYRPGVLLSRSLRGTLPAEFLPELQTGVEDMHARGLVHLDLRHRSNVLAGEDGHPVLLDFATALRFNPTTWWGRWAVSLLGRIDLRALDKWRARVV